ncbi:MAG: Divergent domain protein [Fibrobacteria bacterium]|nr:Divergent domain protein [Fibrobacteria bacterium]
MKPPASPESQILSDVTWDHLQHRLIQRLREQAGSQNAAHPWLGMSDEKLLLEAGLIRRDPDGKPGFTLAAVLLLGTNEAIRLHAPHHGTQAAFHPGKWRRGEVQELRCNLLESQDCLMAFAAKHLPDQIETTPKGERISLRDAIFSEIFSNSLMFRDYGKEYRARFRIEAERVFLENGMVPGKKPGEKYLPNPVISEVFRQIGWARPAAKTSRVSQWGKAYFGIPPMVVEGSVYRILAPFPKSIVSQPPVNHAWDISEMLATQAPWTHSKAAQAEVGATRGALDSLIQGPLLTDVENMRIPEPIEPLDILGRPLRRSPAPVPDLPAPPAATHPAPPEPRIPVRPEPPARTPASPTWPSQASATPQAPVARASGVPANGPAPVAANGFAPARAKVDSRPSVPGLKNQAVLQAERIEKILEFCKTPRYRSEVQAHVGIVNRDYFRKDILNPLIENGLLAPTLPDKPNSPKQQYATVSR